MALGIGDRPVYFLVAVAAVWPVVLSTQGAVQHLERNWLLLARSVGASRWQALLHVVVPAVVPAMVTGVRLAVGLAWVVLVPAEMLGVTSGIGYFILDTRDRLAYPELMAAILTVGALGFSLDVATRALQGALERGWGTVTGSRAAAQGSWRSFPYRLYRCDVAVIGGGLAGLMAAWTAARAGAEVVVLCKGHAGADGCSAFAGGVVLYLLPGDDWKGFLDEHLRQCEGLSISQAVLAVAEANTAIWTELGDLGAPLERDEQGGLRRRWLKVAARAHVPRLALDSVELMRFLRHTARWAGVRFLDQTVVTALLKDGSAVRGVAGFRRQAGELVAVEAPAVVLATGGCSWRGAHMGHHNLQGEGYALASAAGAQLLSMEFCTSYLATCSLFDTHGQCVLAALGGRFRNRLGEDILERRGWPASAPTHVLARALVEEWLSGRGPVVFDLTEIPPAARAHWETRFALVARGLRRTGLDVFGTPVPWVPGFTGSIAGGGGVRTYDLIGYTGIPGLWAVGDTAARTALVGAGSGITFLNLAWAAVSGHWAGTAAAVHAGQARSQGDREQRETAWAAAVAPLYRSDGPVAPDVLRRLQALVTDPAVNFFRTDAGLRQAEEALAEVQALACTVRAGDWHDLARCHEVMSAARVAGAMFDCALYREETRGWHVRLDFPNRDDACWCRWLVWQPGGQVIAVDPLDPAVFVPLTPGVSTAVPPWREAAGND